MTTYVAWALSQIPESMRADPAAFRAALRVYACELVRGRVERMRGKVAGLPLGCPAYLEACMEWDRQRRAR